MDDDLNTPLHDPTQHPDPFLFWDDLLNLLGSGLTAVIVIVLTAALSTFILTL